MFSLLGCKDICIKKLSFWQKLLYQLNNFQGLWEEYWKRRDCDGYWDYLSGKKKILPPPSLKWVFWQMFQSSSCKYQYNGNTFLFQISIFTKLLSGTETHEHGNKEKLPNNRFSLFTCKLRLRCININADHYSYIILDIFPFPSFMGLTL